MSAMPHSRFSVMIFWITDFVRIQREQQFHLFEISERCLQTPEQLILFQVVAQTNQTSQDLNHFHISVLMLPLVIACPATSKPHQG